MNVETTSAPDKAKRVKAAAKISVADYLAQQIQLCGKSQTEIAQEAGFGKPNIITMLKKGTTKLPIAKIGPMARALEVDALHLYKLVMSEYEPDTWEAISDAILKQPFITKNEMGIIEAVRAANVVNPKVRTEEERNRIIDCVSTLLPDNARSGD